jgi:predicted RNase H-like HicB family nuclease
MSRYVYPAVFKQNGPKGYTVTFPDLPECTAAGISLNNGLVRAEDALSLAMYDCETLGKEIPNPTPIRQIEVENDEFVTYIRCDTLGYQRKFNSKAVKKTLTIPEWMNDIATKAGVNFSKLLQDAIIEELKLK